MATSVYCLTNSSNQANLIIDSLRDAGFSANDISVLFPDTHSTQDFAHEKHTKAPEGTATGVTAGGVAGGALGWLIGIGTLAIPGVGPFIAAGPLMAALSGAAIGATVGGITGALIGMGIPEFEAKRYEGKIKQGRILISVHALDGKAADRVKEIFRNSGAEDISSAGETRAPDPARGKETTEVRVAH